MQKLRGKLSVWMTSFKSWYLDHRKISVPLTVVLVAGVGFGVFWFGFRGDGAVTRTDSTSEVEEEQLPRLVPSPLTGVEVSQDLAKRPVIGVMIENSPDARPQSGLADAGVVFEAIAEGGITRFLAIYQEDQPANIGPIRSVRPYYVDWISQFDGALAHVGGSPDGIAKAKSVLGNKDLDQFRYGTKAFDRVSFRSAPHNVYSSMEKLYRIATEAGHNSSSFTSLARKLPAPSPTPNASNVTVNFSSGLFKVVWTWDPTTNKYARANSGVAQNDKHTGAAVKADVIVVCKMVYTSSGGSGRQAVATTGSGEAWIFQDGVVTAGSWNKVSGTSQFVLKDSAGAEISLNPGRTWFEIIPTNQSVTYQ